MLGKVLRVLKDLKVPQVNKVLRALMVLTLDKEFVVK
jgi:hypothetical protein